MPSAILRRRGFSESFSFTPRVVAFASSPRAFLVKDRYTALMANYPDLTRPVNICKEAPFKKKFVIKLTRSPIWVKPPPIATDKMKWVRDEVARFVMR
ncbi:unnamed protein product [Clavelina lepadiformis]|uniref:Uncharacterized protein n=1 Tax=Clavelina lepadiformis TaxID=159417 RepID=A0ABP0G760_CLALP